MTTPEIVGSAGSIATALGVLIAAWHLYSNGKQARTQFEDTFSREYRDLVQTIPVKALLGEPLDEEEYSEAYDELYRYIDLSNSQVFLRQKNRVSKATWTLWADGIKSNLNRPAFRRAWAEIKERAPADFTELRWLESKQFDLDPRRHRKEIGNLS